MRFLVIDDSMPMRRIIANILSRLGHNDVILAANGREALKVGSPGTELEFAL